MGHTDGLCIGDAGLPIPESTERIDLAVRAGLPSFIDVLESVLKELCAERILLAEEIAKYNPEGLEEIKETLARYKEESGYEVEITFVSHENFKNKTGEAKAVVRTGEVKPYANAILYSGVVF